jgi:hypothetical protein
MITFVFVVGLIWMISKLTILGIKMAWGLTKLVFSIFFIPIFLVALACAGLIYLAVPILVIIGILAVAKAATTPAAGMAGSIAR